MYISLIIPFNKPKRYLKDCFESIYEQNLNNFETILILNGNEEYIDDLIEEYRESLNLNIIYFDEEINVAKARNEGIGKATGDYIYFIDSDDYLYQDALVKLVDTAKQTNADFINGERINTAYIKDRFEEQDAIENERFLLKEDRTDLEYSLKLLVGTKTTRLELLSALHSLIKREIIEDLKFDESKRYFTDYEFMLNVIERCNSFIGVERSIYAKRLRDDSIHIPSLNQEEKENEFLMYCETYHYSMNYVKQFDDLKFELLKEYFALKYYRFYLKKFAIRFYNNPDEEWRNENFEAMSEIAKDFDISKSGQLYKKEVNSLIAKDKESLRKYVRIRAAKNKFKIMLKKRWMFKATIYQNYYNKNPVKKNKLLFESFYGKYYSDSPKYIYEYLYENYKDDFEFIWVLNKKNVKIPGNPKIVKRFSLDYYKNLAESEYYIFNTRHPVRLRKKEEEQKFICTWHGTPLKKLGYDQGNLYLNNPRSKHNYRRDAAEWDYMVSPNEYTTKILRSAFAYEGEIIESGYPRNDILYNATPEKIRQIKDDLNLPNDKKIILYAPTWRDDEYVTTATVNFTLELDLKRLQEQFSDEYIILLRMHYFIASNIDLSGLDGFAYNVSDWEDIGELYLISDILITDYSSVFFDYANLKRPMLFFTYDLEKYEDTLRGFYVDMENTVPGPLLMTNDEVIDAINNIGQISEKYAEKYEEFYNRFCYIEDGNASKRIAEHIWKK